MVSPGTRLPLEASSSAPRGSAGPGSECPRAWGSGRRAGRHRGCSGNQVVFSPGWGVGKRDRLIGEEEPDSPRTISIQPIHPIKTG